MLLDDSLAPLVFIRTHAASAIPIEEQLEKLLDKEERFVLVTDHAPDDHHDESVEQRRERALFFKRVKDRMRVLCRGMIVLEGDKPIPAPARLAVAAASKAFGFTVAFAADEEDAIRQGRALLAPGT